MLRPVPRRLLGAGTALALAFAGLLATPASAHAPSPGRGAVPHAQNDGAEGGIPWLMILIGLVVGIGIGMAMVFRAKRAAERGLRDPERGGAAKNRDNGAVGGGD
ncbi:hypothetical protein [Actinomadura sp. NBRC 104425]|uniref:hypothetical protein n=1 Tax=Actinomadura sp. NBRC 104425 TaxID=3032204 RepID=UPI002553A746|nr:hypothetical protein [Actinomadura sp. NBRC 104425]